MERRTKHRILGIIIVAALVILLLPFMQHNKDVPTEVAMVSVPPFPEQKETESMLSDDTIVDSKPTPVAIENHTAKPVPAITENNSTASSATITSNTKTDEFDHAFALVDEAVEKAVHDKKNDQTDISNEQKNIIDPPKKEKRRRHPIIVKEMNKAPLEAASYKKPKMPVITDNGLFDIKMPVWVVQVGMFNSKLKAMRLVNQLRSNHYAAFLQQITTSRGTNHIVFIGPELENDSARAVANDIEKEYHLRGMVVSYKPMTVM